MSGDALSLSRRYRAHRADTPQVSGPLAGDSGRFVLTVPVILTSVTRYSWS